MQLIPSIDDAPAPTGTEPPGTGITAVLGPTNTGKTHRAIERMPQHRSGMIGLPLRLLAREVYDKISARIGEERVALVTGEEKRVPPRPHYWVCTVESMPQLDVDFLAVDEIQLAAHHQRGHTFTDRLLHARGVHETWFLGAETIAPLLDELVPTARIETAPRLSRLSYTGTHGIGSLPPRTAVVAFSRAPSARCSISRCPTLPERSSPTSKRARSGCRAWSMRTSRHSKSTTRARFSTKVRE